MSVKRTVRQQYQMIVDETAGQVSSLRMPREGWLRTVRKALGMSGAQLARRMGVTRARTARAEQAELTGSITLKSMEAAAQAMGCKFVYAIVPQQTVEDLIQTQARKKALALIRTAGSHMALEDQTLPDERIEREVEQLGQDLARSMPSDFWDDA